MLANKAIGVLLLLLGGALSASMGSFSRAGQFPALFVLLLGLALAFYGLMILVRQPWALLVGTVLAATLALYAVVAVVLEVVFRPHVIDTLPSVSDRTLLYYGLIAGTAVMALLLAYSTLRLQSDENRDAYAMGLGATRPPVDICDTCGRVKTEEGCPVHDRAPVRWSLVRQDTGEVFGAEKEAVRIGSGPKSDILFDRRDDKHPEYRTISAEQAAVVWVEGKYYIRNKSLTNPTMVNGKALVISEGQEWSDSVPLEDGDQIALGTAHFTFHTGDCATAVAGAEISR